MSALLKRELEKEFEELERKGRDGKGTKKPKKLAEQLPTTRCHCHKNFFLRRLYRG
jgi:hypothetical protein